MSDEPPALVVVAILYPNSGGLAPWRIECDREIFERMSMALRSVGEPNAALGAALVSYCVALELESGDGPCAS